MSPVGEKCSEFGSISPISKEQIAPTYSRCSSTNKGCLSLSTSSIFRSTPEKENSLSLEYRTCSSNSLNHMSVDRSISVSNAQNTSMKRKLQMMKSFHSDDISQADDKDQTVSDSNESIFDDECMMLSESQQSNSSLHPQTPTRRSKFRIANRKNLSHSFSSCQSDEHMQDDQTQQPHYNADPQQENHPAYPKQLLNETSNDCVASVLSKTDSGFNDMEEL